MKAYVFPGQGAQYVGMGKDLYDNYDKARSMMEHANEILGFRITDLMFEGTDDDLKRTSVTQPAVFIQSVAYARVLGDGFNADMVAGHSLGEFSALVAARALSFVEGLQLVAKRARAMQHACELTESTMAAILGLPDETVEAICADTKGIVRCANYNCPGQIVVSGVVASVKEVCDKAKAAGARRALVLNVGGGFHSPCMEPAREELAAAIEAASFQVPQCPVYQNVDAKPHTDPDEIKANLISQLTAPVRWTRSIQNMVADGASEFVELGPGKVLQGMISKIDHDVAVSGAAQLFES